MINIDSNNKLDKQTILIKRKINREKDKKTLEKILNFTLPKNSITLSYTKNKAVAIAALANYEKDLDIELTLAGFGNWASRYMFKDLADYIFNQLNCKRLTIRVYKENKQVVKMVEKFGFMKEGELRVHEINLYSLLKTECKYL